MKLFKNILSVLAICLAMCAPLACQREMPEEITGLDLYRCLEPMNLNAKVSSSLGDVVTFSWDVSKDAEKYKLIVCTDEALQVKYLEEELEPSQVPYTVKLTADQTYYFKVQATSTKKTESKWAEYGKAVKTFAVKDPLFLKVSERTATSITLSWSTEVADFMDVSHIEYCVTGSDGTSTRKLSEDEIKAGKATVEGLTASTEYDLVLYYLSASRGEVDAWTMPDLSGTAAVSTVAALGQAVTDGANILLKMEGSPYDLTTLNPEARLTLVKGVKILGEEAADGTKPVIKGELHFADTWANGDAVYFEGVEFNGNSGAFGFAIQKLNGGTADNIQIASIIFKNCVITGYSKGLIYEWSKTMTIGELTWDSCDINNINSDGSGGGDVVDFRGNSQVDKLNIVNSTIYQGMRTFVRIDAGTWGAIRFENNTLMNLNFVDNTNNAGIFGLQVVPASFSFKNNLFLNMEGKATLASANTKYKTADDMSVSASNNWFYNIVDTYFTDTFPFAKTGGTMLGADPCYNAKAALFNINPDSEIAGKEVGAPKWWVPYVEEPEDLTLNTIPAEKTWDLGNAKFFSGTSKKSMVRDDMMIVASENNPVSFTDGVMNFESATVCNKKGVPAEGYVCFKVDKPGSVVVKPVGGETAHVIVGVSKADGSEFVVKGGASAMADGQNPQKILISDIGEESLVYVYVSGPIGISEIAWSNDVSQTNRALPAPDPKADPESFTQGEGTDIVVSWEPVANAASYSVVFSGKTYAVDEGTSYTIEAKTTAMLDPGSYTVKVLANPGKNDIYNTESDPGVAAFAVLPKGGGGDDEFIVSNAEEFLNALAAGKDFITFKYSDTPHAVGAVTITAPLHLKGQTVGGKKTPITGSFTISGKISGSVVLKNLEFAGDGSSVIIDDKNADCAPVADTVAIYDSYLHGTKALYDNSGKAKSDIQYVIFKGNIIDGCSDGADFIDMRDGAHHNFFFVENTVANSCRTFVRTDAAHEMNYATIRNNTFYKVATNSGSKDNNGIFHIRSAAGSGLISYKVQNNLFYSILIDTEPSNPAGFPKFKSKAGLTPGTITNNYFFNCEDREEKAAYSFWSYITKEETLTGHGAILPADPCKDAANGDFTLTNGVAMNANVGDPRWNPMHGSTPTSEITVNNIDELLTAISAGKSTITLATGEYDLTAVADNPDVASGKLTLVNSLNLIGQSGAKFIGGLLFKAGVDKFSANGVAFDGAASVDNVFEIAEEKAALSSVIVKNCTISAYKNRLFYMNNTGSVQSLEFVGDMVTGIAGADFTSGDFIDIRKGTATAIKVRNCTFANCVRTFARIDAATVLSSMEVSNNTFWNLCYVDSKDNNGIFHVRATSLDEANYNVRSNIFAGMHRAAETPGNAAGYPKLVSTNTASKIPTFRHNYFFDLDHAEGYDFWTAGRITEEVATAGNGIVLTESPFKDAAAGDFTLVSALAASEKVGDQRWNPNRPERPDGFFEAADLAALLTAIDAGKKNIVLTGASYDFTADETLAGKLSVTTGLNIKGETTCGVKPEIIGVFDVATAGDSFELNDLRLNGNASQSDMVVINAAAKLTKLAIVNCDVTAYKNRLISGPNASTCGPVIVTGCVVSGVEGANFTGGDFIDFRKGSVSSIKVTRSTFYNAVRTFVRVDAAVGCGAVNVENNTFYNVLTALSKDNNGIMHVRSTAATSNPRQIVVRRNIFACSMPDEAGLATAADNVKAAGFPKLVSTASETIAHPTCSDNLFYGLKTEGDYNWWNTVTPEAAAAAGTVLTDTPFSGDPATGKFTVKAAYKGYGDTRW